MTFREAQTKAEYFAEKSYNEGDREGLEFYTMCAFACKRLADAELKSKENKNE